jgi:hypothetical protein
MLQFFGFMAFVAMVGLISKNTTMSAVLGIFFPFLFSAIFFGLHESGILKGDRFWYGFFEALYWIFPKTPELTEFNIRVITLDPGQTEMTPIIWSTVGFAVVCFAIGVYIFQKRSY